VVKNVRTSLSAVAVAGALVIAGTAAAPDAGASPQQRRQVARTAPRWVAGAHALGRAPASARSTFKVYLAPRGGTAALTAAVAAVSDPRSPRYRHFLTAAQYHASFDATGASVRAVSRWLRSNHLSVASVEAHHRYLSVTGTNASVQKAFGVVIKRFRHEGRVVQANTSAVKVPAGIAPLVWTVSGLDTTPRRVTHAAAEPPPPGFRNARPCSHYYGQLHASKEGDFKTPLPKFDGKTLPYVVCGYTGVQLRTAYEGATAATLDGTGTTVAVTDAYASPTIAQDASRYAVSHGDGSYAPGQLQQVRPASFRGAKECQPSGWYSEETLDVEAVHAMAPGADIRYYASRSCFDADFLTTLGKVVDENKASIVSNSWSAIEAGQTTDGIAAYEQVILQGAMQGMSFLFSSGDDGDELVRTSLKEVGYPASDPYVTAVGGTSDAIGPDGRFLGQTGWGTERFNLSPSGTWTSVGFTSGAGGGMSGLFNRPAYQDGVVPARLGAGRGVPDVGLDADPNTGFLIGQTQTFPDGAYYSEYRLGGTSLASPLFAGMTALTQQHAHGRLGFLNPAIYELAGSAAFRDVKGPLADVGNVRADFVNSLDAAGGVAYSVRVFDRDSSLQVTKGWDQVTGVGSPGTGWITAVGAP
jgi:subtilase family serine protease